MLWQHGEKELEKCLEFLKCYHPTVKYTASYSHEEINFLDVSVKIKNNQFVSDLYIKPTGMHQYLQTSSCHVYHSTHFILYTQALHLNKIFSENLSYEINVVMS